MVPHVEERELEGRGEMSVGALAVGHRRSPKRRWEPQESPESITTSGDDTEAVGGSGNGGEGVVGRHGAKCDILLKK